MSRLCAGNRRRPDRAQRAAARRSFFARLGRAFLVVGGSLVVAAGLAAGGRAAWRFFTASPHFAVARIAVSGVRRLSADAVRARSGLVPGVNVFRADLAGAQRALAQDPWIRRASVTRELPRTLRIAVDERRPVARIALGALYLADEDGTLFARAQPADAPGRPLITGLSRDRFAADPEGFRADLDLALTLAAEVARRRLAGLSEVHVDRDLGLTALFAPGPSLALGRDGFADKLDRWERARTLLARRGLSVTSADLADDRHPDRVVVVPAAGEARAR